MTKIEKAVHFMETIANDETHGYDQTCRWGVDYDCSSLVITAWEESGVKVKTAGATYTGNMYKVFTSNGFTDVTSAIDLPTGKGLQVGDVLLNTKHHVAMYCGEGKEVEASINEKGTTTGGQTGDQTGKEILIRPYRNYPWDYVLRYTAESFGNVCNSTSCDYTAIARDVIAGKYGNGAVRKRRLESAGYNYLVVQKKVNELLRGN